MVIADVEVLGPALQNLDQLRIAVAQIVDAAVEMDVDQALSVHVVEEVAFAAVDDQIDPHVLPGLGFAGIPPGLRLVENRLLCGAPHLRILSCGPPEAMSSHFACGRSSIRISVASSTAARLYSIGKYSPFAHSGARSA